MYRNYNTDSQLTKTMTEDQFDRVVGAISSGKYSWACLLILRFAGYNPLHYISLQQTNKQQTLTVWGSHQAVFYLLMLKTPNASYLTP